MAYKWGEGVGINPPPGPKKKKKSNFEVVRMKNIQKCLENVYIIKDFVSYNRITKNINFSSEEVEIQINDLHKNYFCVDIKYCLSIISKLSLCCARVPVCVCV